MKKEKKKSKLIACTRPLRWFAMVSVWEGSPQDFACGSPKGLWVAIWVKRFGFDERKLATINREPPSTLNDKPLSTRLFCLVRRLRPKQKKRVGYERAQASENADRNREPYPTKFRFSFFFSACGFNQGKELEPLSPTAFAEAL